MVDFSLIQLRSSTPIRLYHVASDLHGRRSMSLLRLLFARKGWASRRVGLPHISLALLPLAF
jgi:hypothetical protein